MGVSNWDAFSTALKQLLDGLRGNASSGGTLRKPPPATETVLPSTPPGEKKLSKTWIVFVASTVVAVLLIVIIVFFLIVNRRKRHFSRRLRYKEEDDVIMAESLQFNLDLIVEATENFSDSKKLGQGGFGCVYLGKLPNGQEIAVKRLSRNSGQGQIEFKNEVVLLAKLQHRNLVRLLGFCLEGEERLLVYEFVPNSSLDQFIFDPIKRAHLNWDTRYKIITGIARGLMYLHEDSRLRIIHRDLKASNILLDADMNPKVSDFGMARLFELDQTQADTNRIVGTYGYMAPEYVLHGHISLKSDVFSFGVLVLEIVSGRKNLDFRSHPGGDPEILISHVWRSWQEGKIQDIVDPSLTSSYRVDIMRCIHIGLLCVQENVASRPTMASVIVMLNSHSATLSVPTQPAFSMNNLYSSDISASIDGTSTVTHSNHSGNKGGTVGGTHSVNEVSITEPYPR
ncbi:hypothetical protein MLD38_036921 [Melastoma candidum]|uniref:Uncharacterized protein n=1 Tax=Melastoma candidum TaxID=119954 RepID=A0ACB9LLE2_9MYRT|nr:hypothetical protein MLD38_036921 [Melastoma candidum]